MKTLEDAAGQHRCAILCNVRRRHASLCFFRVFYGEVFAPIYILTCARPMLMTSWGLKALATKAVVSKELMPRERSCTRHGQCDYTACLSRYLNVDLGLTAAISLQRSHCWAATPLRHAHRVHNTC